MRDVGIIPGSYEISSIFYRDTSFEDGVEPWTRQVSHGEMIRDGNDERMVLDPNNLMFLYQGLDPARTGGDYGALPYKLGLLRAVKE